MGIDVGQLPDHILFQLIFTHGPTLCIPIDTHGGLSIDDLLDPFDAFLGLEGSNIFECNGGGKFIGWRKDGLEMRLDERNGELLGVDGEQLLHTDNDNAIKSVVWTANKAFRSRTSSIRLEGYLWIILRPNV